MTGGSGSPSAVAALRRAFDESFARPPHETATDLVPVLAVRIGGDAHVIRILELTGIVRSRTIVAVPSRAPEVLGLAGIRGGVVPVYALDVLLGYEAGAREGTGWLALCGTNDPLGLALGEPEGYLAVDRAEIHAVAEGRPRRPHVREIVRLGALAHGVIDVPALVGSIRRRAGQNGRPEERQP